MDKDKTVIYIRCSEDLKAELEKLAAEDDRSLNSYIVTILKRIAKEGNRQ